MLHSLLLVYSTLLFYASPFCSIALEGKMLKYTLTQNV